MNTLVVYDSEYGDTYEIAQEVAGDLAGHGRTRLANVDEVTNADIKGIDLLVVGSPTQGGRPTEKMHAFLAHLPDLSGMQAAAFDTRFSARGRGPAMSMLMKVIGYASEKMAKTLEEKGATLITEPVGFIVEDRTGPLRDGELEKADNWVVSMFQLV